MTNGDVTFYVSGFQLGAILSPRGHWQFLETVFTGMTGGRGCYWHLGGKSQGRRSTSYSAQDAPSTESSSPPPHVNSTAVEKPFFTVVHYVNILGDEARKKSSPFI